MRGLHKNRRVRVVFDLLAGGPGRIFKDREPDRCAARLRCHGQLDECGSKFAPRPPRLPRRSRKICGVISRRRSIVCSGGAPSHNETNTAFNLLCNRGHEGIQTSPERPSAMMMEISARTIGGTAGSLR